MIRLLKIARREYVAYVRTVGFWLSIAMLPLMAGVLGGAPALMLMTAPPARLAVVDLTGGGYAGDIEGALTIPIPSRPGAPPRKLARIVPAAIGPVHDAAEAGRLVRPLLLGAGRRHPAQIDGAAVIHDEAGAVQVDFWSRNLPDPVLRNVVRQAVAERMRARRLEAEGISPAVVAALKSVAPAITDYSARAAARTGLRDRIPGIVGLGFGMLLWMAAISGAGILLSSVVEEKSSRVLEVLLASAAPSEIMLGKVLGVACVTLTVLGTWIGLGAVGLYSAAPGIAGDVAAALLDRGLVVYLLIYLVGGYLMYASAFAAIGSFCETTREAQTLVTPIMLLLTVPMVFLSQAILRPDAPLLTALSWFPPFTPFLMPARAAAHPPTWQLAGSAAFMLATAGASLWISTRAFALGALSGGRVEPRKIVRLLLGRSG
jgi:ABC-2 type transport system permease protein